MASLQQQRQNIKVFCRIRPPNPKERKAKSKECLKVPSSVSVALDGSQNFTYDGVFPLDSNQLDVYSATASHIVDDALNGFNCTIFAYGQTGSGKTHTMMGPDPKNISDETERGIIPRICQDIFSAVEEADAALEFTIKVGFVEIYLEKIRDLLEKFPGKHLRVREDRSRGVWIEGMKEVYVSCEEEMMELVTRGNINRAIATTNMNKTSSRSHSVFIATLTQIDTRKGAKKSGQLFLVDLAGSETVKRTGATGTILEEAVKINQSLSALGNVINSLTSGSKHVPYRDSKLTRLLQHSLGGSSKTSLIITCSPVEQNKHESLSTLRFGARAKTIKNKPVANLELSVAEYKRQLNDALNQIENLKTQLGNKGLSFEGVDNTSEELKNAHERIDALESQLEDVQSDLLESQEKHDELEEENSTLKTSELELQRCNEELRATEHETRGALENAKFKLEQMQNALDQQQFERTSHEETVKQLEQQIKTLQQSFEEQKKLKREAESKMEEYNDDKEELQEALKMKDIAFKRLEEKMQETEEELVASRVSDFDLSSVETPEDIKRHSLMAFPELQSELKEENRRLSEQIDTYKSLKGQKGWKRMMAQRNLKSRVERLSKENSSIIEDLALVRNENRLLKGKLRKSENELNEYIDANDKLTESMSEIGRNLNVARRESEEACGKLELMTKKNVNLMTNINWMEGNMEDMQNMYRELRDQQIKRADEAEEEVKQLKAIVRQNLEMSSNPLSARSPNVRSRIVIPLRGKRTNNSEPLNRRRMQLGLTVSPVPVKGGFLNGSSVNKTPNTPSSLTSSNNLYNMTPATSKDLQLPGNLLQTPLNYFNRNNNNNIGDHDSNDSMGLHTPIRSEIKSKSSLRRSTIKIDATSENNINTPSAGGRSVRNRDRRITPEPMTRKDSRRGRSDMWKMKSDHERRSSPNNTSTPSISSRTTSRTNRTPLVAKMINTPLSKQEPTSQLPTKRGIMMSPSFQQSPMIPSPEKPPRSPRKRSHGVSPMKLPRNPSTVPENCNTLSVDRPEGNELVDESLHVSSLGDSNSDSTTSGEKDEEAELTDIIHQFDN